MRKHQLSKACGVAVALVVAASCGGNEDEGTASTTPVVVSTSKPSTTSEPSTTPAPTSPPTAPRTTEATTTTIDAVAAAKRAVAEAAVASREGYLYAVRNYDAPDAIEVLSRTHAAGSPALQGAIANMDRLRSNGWRTRANPAVDSTLTVEGTVQLLDGPPATRAEVTVCEIGAGIVYEPGGGLNGEDAIVNDEIVARRNRTTLVVENGAWKIESGTNLGEWPGEATCPAA